MKGQLGLLSIGWIVGLVLTVALSSNVLATADGPDTYDVTGVAANDVLNIRAEPSYRSAKIGEIPHNGRGLENLGCKGALPNRWCRINYQGVEGWVSGKFLREGN
jgi:uncharacterized protein YraI